MKELTHITEASTVRWFLGFGWQLEQAEPHWLLRDAIGTLYATVDEEAAKKEVLFDKLLEMEVLFGRFGGEDVTELPPLFRDKPEWQNLMRVYNELNKAIKEAQ